MCLLTTPSSQTYMCWHDVDGGVGRICKRQKLKVLRSRFRPGAFWVGCMGLVMRASNCTVNQSRLCCLLEVPLENLTRLAVSRVAFSERQKIYCRA